jgi:uncharacterized repeat protein (TIGR04076 family)
MFPQAKNLAIEVVKVNGNCPTYKVGDQFNITGGYKLTSNIPVCLHALHALTPYYIPLSRGISPYDLGLASINANQNTPDAYIQCHDPEEITGGGSVIFRISITK